MKCRINFPMQRTIFSSVPRVFIIRIEIAGNSHSSRALTALTTHRRFAKRLRRSSASLARSRRSDTLSDTRNECAPSPCVPRYENPKFQKIHVFLPCEQSADEPHGSMIHAVRRIVASLEEEQHPWRVMRIKRDPSDPSPHHAPHSGQVCFAPKRHTHLGVTRRTLLLDSTTVATTATPEAGRRPNSSASDRDVSRRRRRRIRPRTYGNISSAMMTALSAAPRSSWSPHTKRSRPYSPNTSFLRTRPTSTSYLVDAVSGIG